MLMITQVLRLLADEPTLLEWARRMNARVGADYPWLLSATLDQTEPSMWSGLVLCSTAQRVAFWLGVLVFGTVLLPVTLLAFAYHWAVRSANPNRSLALYFAEVDRRGKVGGDRKGASDSGLTHTQSSSTSEKELDAPLVPVVVAE